ncbi:translesion error-prone DNA polymerase V autoproteolytic subunit [Acinetobacter baumannii]|nr:translesion error-prone DNA polymerase V autoproteolytic subunit [Acinetobacter baumannii]
MEPLTLPKAKLGKFLPRTIQHSDLRSVYEISPRTHFTIPLVLDRIQAGFPSPAQDYVEKLMDMNEHLIRNECATFIVKVCSLSMINAGIDINDELVVDRSLKAKHNDIIVALIDNEFTVKRLQIDSQGIWLKAENPDFNHIYLKDGQVLVCWGVVTFILKNVRKNS